MNSTSQTNTHIQETEPAWFAIVRDQVERLNFGTVQITVHNGRVTQVDATLRTRLEPVSQIGPASPGAKTSAARA